MSERTFCPYHDGESKSPHACECDPIWEATVHGELDEIEEPWWE